MNPTSILFVIALLLVVVAIIKSFSPKYRLEGDLSLYDDSQMAALQKLDLLSGDINDSGLVSLADALEIPTRRDKFVLTGDIDEIEEYIEDDSNIGEGNLFKRIKAKRTAKKEAKQAKKSGFNPNLLGRAAVAETLKSETDLAQATSKVSQIMALSQTPGALLSNIEVARLQVTGGVIKQKETSLNIPGKNFATALTLWEQFWPGLSRSESKISVGAPLVWTFKEPNPGEIGKAQIIIINIAGSENNKIKFAEVDLKVEALADDGTPIVTDRDRIELFTNDAFQKTMIVYIPFKKIQETLFAVALASPTTAAPVKITLGGVPTGVSVTARLSGIDDEDFIAYKAMVGLK